MKINLTLLLAACAAFFTTKTFAQVNVSPLTGSANVVIPVWTFNRGQVSFPVNLVYNGNGVHVKDVEGSGGIGWNLQAGGQISRQLRGLPDDCNVSGMLGWMNTANTANTYIGGIDDNLGNCTNETADLATISSHLPYTTDTEPDIFYVNAPGLSCQLVYDKTLPGFRPLNYQDLKITYTTGSQNDITSFTITNDKGIKYYFGNPDQLNTTTPGSATPAYFNTKYLQYHSGINYYDNWHLVSETDANFNGIQLSYTTGHPRYSTDSVAVYIGGSSTATRQYYIKQYTVPQILSTVSSSDGDQVTLGLTFTWTSSSQSGGGTDQNYISSIVGMGKNLNFTYSPVKYVTAGGANYYRQFLRTFIDGTDPNSPTNYTFAYYGETLTSGNYTTTLPDSSSKKVDYWGYYGSNANTALLPKVWVNPSNTSYPRYLIYQSATGGTNYPYSLTGNNMSVDATNIITGALKTITTLQGAVTTITYEPNDYADPQSGVVNAGGGIRVKQVEAAGGFSTPSIITNYSYTGPTGVSSGKPVSLPQFAFTIPYGGSATGATLWANATALSTTDLSEEDHTIMYGYCKQSRTNNGVVQYQYYVPATNWDTGAHAGCDACTTTEWLPTFDMIARHNCASTYGPVANLATSYPFIPNPNYDFERGLLQKVTTYLDDGSTKVSETSYTYQRSFTPSAIYGFRNDDITSGTLVITGYNKYNIYYNTSELSKSVTKTVYDSPTYSVAQTSTTNYTFGSAYHKLLTQQDLLNSDGTTLTTKMSYTKDFPSAGSGTNVNVTAIYNMNQLNMNIQVETIQQVTKGGTTNIIGGSLTLFKAFPNISTTSSMPSQQLRLVQAGGIPSTSFVPFTATGSGSSQSISMNSHYFPVANFTSYDYAGFLLTSDDNNHHVVTQAPDHNIYKTSIVAKNVASNELAYSDFGYQIYIPGFYITGTGGSVITNGGHTGNGYAFTTAQTATATVSKNALTQKYIFSIWINAPAGTKTLNLSLNGGTPVAYTYTGTGAWKYYEWPITVTTMPSSFTFAFTSLQAVSIDDILFYPSTAEVATFSYDNMSNATASQTDTNGISTYYINDTWGRVLYVLDQDHNIVQRNKYLIQLGN
ncbi:hypothetical protein KXD93_29445 [Mucilaginibacter sp. BJC16-A38]|uniref:hypothetical protein n=1 Tax=Mucilaginibacter phenanthrenivorans TaxID=1234842 RepID=UPI002158966F|nr:hypothetical protein [Mucilaginibacter phenanthrenivorans]MCR8561817.1 hypothetical protein [Mucilaginibacter phenanthrenivorans]